ncbi:hypothetical protein JCM10213_001614, partial [Rhodosporidiobolus nylandii]
TQRKYARVLTLWRTFTSLYHLRDTPTASSLVLFLAYLDRRDYRSLPQALSALRAHFRRRCDWDSIRQSGAVKDALAGAAKARPKDVKRAKPIAVADLKSILGVCLRRGTYNALLCAAIVVVAFCGLLRLGEAVMPQHKEDRILAHFAKRSSVSLTATSLSFHLPHQKNASSFEGGEVVITGALAPSDLPVLPVLDVFRAFLRARDAHVPKSGVLFAKKDGSLISRSTVTKLLKAAGSFTGHSLRSGGATWLAEQGVDFDTIRRCGRWRSSAF